MFMDFCEKNYVFFFNSKFVSCLFIFVFLFSNTGFKKEEASLTNLALVRLVTACIRVSANIDGW